MAHIRKRIDSKGAVSYQVIIESAPDPITGKRSRKYVTVHGTKKQAEALKQQLVAEMELGHTLSVSHQLLRHWMEEWMDVFLPSIAPSTRIGYKEKINGYIIPHLGNTPLKDLQPTQIQRWVNHLYKDKGLAPKTIKNAFQNLNAALDKAVTVKKINQNPCRGVELPKGQKYVAKFYEDEEISRMFEAAKGTDIYLMVLMLTYFGCRRGELAAIKWTDVNFEERTIDINKSITRTENGTAVKGTKTQAGMRKISFGNDMYHILKQAHSNYLAQKLQYGPGFCDEGYIICQPNGKGYNPDSLTQKWERFIKANNLPHIRLHDLRHTSATLMIGAGIDLKTVQHRLGHSTSNMTLNVYSHCSRKMEQSAATKMDEIVLGN